MDYDPIGALCTSLGLLTPDDVVRVLERQAAGERRRFGDVALEMGLLDEGSLARVLATQHRLNCLSDAALDGLTVSDAAFDRVPVPILRRHGLVPIGWNEDQDVISVVGPDPTDTIGLEAVRSYAGARAVRLFVATRSGVAALLDRLLGPPEDLGSGDLVPEIRPLPEGLRQERVLVLEMDERRSRLLRRLDGVEEGTAAFASDPAQVARALENRQIGRVLVRDEVAEALGDWEEVWRRTRPDLVVQRVSAFGPSQATGAAGRAVSAFHIGFLRFLLAAAETRDLEVRTRAWRAVSLAQAAARALGIAPDQVEAVVLATLVCELEDFTFLKPLARFLTREEDPGSRFPVARSLLAAFSPPGETGRILDALEHRLAGGGPIGAHLGAEIAYTVRTVVRRSGTGQADPVSLLGDAVAHHAPRVVAAVASVLQWDALGTEGAPAGATGGSVLVALADPELLSCLEVALAQAGFRVLFAASGPEVVRTAAASRPACIVADLGLPRIGGRLLVATLRESETTRRIPVLLVADPSARASAAQAIEDGAEDVLVRPVDLDLLLGKVKRAAARGRVPEEAGIRGRLGDLPLPDLVQTLTLGGRTASVQVRSGALEGEIGIVKGSLVAARLGEDRGERALERIVALREGTFVVTIGEVGLERNLAGSTEWLLLEALRLSDEAQGHP
ncbi:MAG: DUF4388 domain-containing protein [Deltaproteobacteria bacterium]|nr:DUF4388 domain-containing protein [Deltaproteobacteria bacterium]